MLTNISTKIDRFYLFLGIVLFVLAVVVSTTLRSVFGAFNTANMIDEKSLQSEGLHINEAKINQALEKLNNKKSITLDLP